MPQLGKSVQTWFWFRVLVLRLFERFLPCLGTPYNSSSSVVVLIVVVVVFLGVVFFCGLTGRVTLGG